jgi:hypothetical protein
MVAPSPVVPFDPDQNRKQDIDFQSYFCRITAQAYSLIPR